MINKERLSQGIQTCLDQGTYRTRFTRHSPQSTWVASAHNPALLSFCSNDYLACANHPKVCEAFHSGIKRYGAGSGSSALMCGYSQAHEQLEGEIAAFLQRPAALIFSTGYMANLGVLSAFLGRHDHVFQDKFNHASLMDAAVLCRAHHHRFGHADTRQLEQQLNTTPTGGQRWIVSDGVFSTQGDTAPLPALVALSKSHNAVLMVDDAHGIGCLGTHGRGAIESEGIDSTDVDLLVGTFGKALGTFGAFVSGSQLWIDALVQSARTYRYTTALPPALIEATRASLKLIQEEPERRRTLHQRIDYFKQQAQALGLPCIPSNTAIQALFIGQEQRADDISRALLDQGLLVKAFRKPTVPEGKALLRITLTSGHSTTHIDQLLEALCGFL